MAHAELTQFVQERFDAQEQRFGFTNPKEVARAITQKPNSPLTNQLERTVKRMADGAFVYNGAKETLGSLLHYGDTVAIWTQGEKKAQHWKIATSGIGDLRKNLPVSERKRFSVHAYEDKITPLPEILAHSPHSHIVIVDDKAENIKKVSETIKNAQHLGTLRQDISVTPVWINQGRTKNQVPSEYTVDAFKKEFTTIEDISELQNLRADVPTTWLVDFDHTLYNTSSAKQVLFDRLADTLETAHPKPVISPRLDLEIGLNGNVLDAFPLLSGMSGGTVMQIVTQEGTFVAKYNPNDPKKIAGEIKGYKYLQETPLSSHLLSPFYASETKGILVIPFAQGIQLREGIKQEKLSPRDAITVVSDLLSLKIKWWQGQGKKQPDHSLRSMQRTEWEDTIKNAANTTRMLSEKYGISQQALWTQPIEINGQDLPPLISVFAQFADFIHQPPPFTLASHADATGANIIIDPETHQWTLLDHEWAGQADPAESFVRMVKYVSTTTAKQIEIDATCSAGKVKIEGTVDFSPSSLAIQKFGLSMAPHFQTELQDPEFVQRVKHYLVGSYLREFALSLKRGSLEHGLAALMLAYQSHT